MYFIATLCVLLISCTIQVTNADALNSLRYQLQRSKSNVETLISDLKRHRNNLQFNTQLKLGNKKSESMRNLNDFVNPTLDQILADVNAATAEGKDAVHCYNNARDALRTISLNGFADLGACEKNVLPLLETHLNKIQLTESTGTALINQLNNIFPNCYNNNILQMQTCIAIQLGTVNMSIRAFETNCNTIKLQANKGASDAIVQETSCNFDVVSKARSKTTDVRLAANNCLKTV